MFRKRYDLCVQPNKYRLYLPCSDIVPATTTTWPATTSSEWPATTSTEWISVEESDVLINSGNIPTAVYVYDPILKTVTLLDISNIVNMSPDLAHTENKLWIYSSPISTLKEYDITLSPFTAVFNKEITGYKYSAGLCAINDTTLLAYSVIISPNYGVYESSIVGTTFINTLKFTTLPSRTIIGDFILTTTNKFIYLNNTTPGGVYKYITQYDYLTGLLEFDIEFTGSIAAAHGLFEYDDEIYITATIIGPPITGAIYHIEKTSPYTITLYDTMPFAIYGASQLPSKLTVHFSV
jgi:hypothetical protein